MPHIVGSLWIGCRGHQKGPVRVVSGSASATTKPDTSSRSPPAPIGFSARVPCSIPPGSGSSVTRYAYNRHLPAGLTPRLQRSAEAGGWLIAAFDYASGRSADLRPGSPELPTPCRRTLSPAAPGPTCPPTKPPQYCERSALQRSRMPAADTSPANSCAPCAVWTLNSRTTKPNLDKR